MKYFEIILLLMLSGISEMNLYAQEPNSNEHETSSESDKNQQDHPNVETNSIISFMAAKEHEIAGEYWPASKIILFDLDQKPINTASAYIQDDSYSNVIEKESLQTDQESNYIGYFIDKTTKKTIYLYGMKDEQRANDAPDSLDSQDENPEHLETQDNNMTLEQHHNH